jgi:hypothetical protein
MSNDHDSSYKFLFSTPELVRDLILGFVPDDWLHSLDYTTLEKVPGSYVSEDFRHRADDIATVACRRSCPSSSTTAAHAGRGSPTYLS